MIEREDIDALLVGALYGELDAAEQARLDEHLVSHPADASALDELKAVRGRVTSSRIFEVQAEPPQHVSALLLQEAARRAPAKPRVVDERSEGWFARFVKSFVAHPAMAAAATLVLVVGVAGTMYLKNGSRPTAADQMTASAPAEKASGAANGDNGAAGSAMVAMGSSANVAVEQKAEQLKLKQDSMQVALDEGGATGQAAVKTPAADPSPAKAVAAAHRSQDLAFGNDNRKGGDGAADKKEVAVAKKPAAYVEVQGNRPTPKDLDRADKFDDAEEVAQAPSPKQQRPVQPQPAAPATTTATMGMAGGGAQAPTAAPPPPPPQEATVTKSTKEAQPSEVAWAKDQHARVTALVKDGKCQEAAPIARAIRNRTPGYFNSYVATDRELKGCMPYIQDTATNSPKAAEKRAVDAR
ncbi:MAG: hypothetical protein QM831_25210 [Kofleriaceae bacterium]